MKRLSSADYATIIYQAYQPATTAERSTIVTNFLTLLRRHRAMKLWPRIISHLQTMIDQAAGRTRVHVTVPQVVPEKELTAVLTKTLGPVALTVTADENLLGGAVIRVGDQEIDGSIRSKLNQLKTHLINQ